MWQQGTSTVSHSTAGKLLSTAEQVTWGREREKERESDAVGGKAAPPGRPFGAGSFSMEHRLVSALLGWCELLLLRWEVQDRDGWASQTQTALRLDESVAVLPR